ncbi:aspartate aminotransferase family protein [Barnesiella viscericola]|uniref:Aminotransferase class III-fold pyridoxal phosphate-dependent enzyme n=1 Tax=Barnesiella viscericola TaxID=397865 RepID=A0A921STU1_9BACT|nr:aminotransferase class III-fold pyridoxal phosphate-dependent enzyme [Barnesiella viscericola]HJG88011.1 aminotransferase class III-fold pyridoxal phosphate-dependent enzyme [Barnesiella viscericola]
MKLFDVYPLFDLEIVSGKGCYTYDSHGTEYLDLYGGHAVISIGHSHPYYVNRITEQAKKLVFYSNSVVNSLQQQLADKLGALSGYDDYSLFLINSGAEANENALKLASFHTGKKKVIAFAHSFHGRTSAAVKVTDNPRIVAPINDTFEVAFLPLNDMARVEQELAAGDVCAVIIEGIQGVGGIQIPEVQFLQELREACSRHHVVLILDEVQSGYGRTGKFFAHQYAGIRPDLITVAKGMGNGFPIGGVLISPRFTPVYGMLGTTFGGNHLACTAACAVLDVMRDEHLVDNAARVGQYLIDRLREIPQIKEVRGKGLMIGLEFDQPVKELRNRLLFEQHVFTGASGTHVIRLLPPLSLSQEQADCFIGKLKNILS